MRIRLRNKLGGWSGVVLSCCLLARDPIFAQAVPSVRLGVPEAESQPVFDGLIGARELSDRQLIVAALRMPQLSVVNRALNEVRDLLRRGSGPAEYLSISRIHPLGGDSTLIEDRQAGRWIIIQGTQPVRTSVVQRAGAWNGPRIVGADRFGNVLEIRDLAFAASAGGPRSRSHADADSMLAVRLRRAIPMPAPGGRLDTIARLTGYFRGVSRATRAIGAGVPVEWWIRNPFSTEDQAIQFEDGWIAIAYVQPYRVDWVRPDGMRVIGKRLPFVSLNASLEEQRFASREAYPRVSPAFEPSEFAPWPPEVPPFLSEAVRRDVLFRGANGALLVERTSAATRKERLYDMVDREGRLRCRVLMVREERIIGAGVKSLITARAGADDLESIRRYAWPRECDEKLSHNSPSGIKRLLAVR